MWITDGIIGLQEVQDKTTRLQSAKDRAVKTLLGSTLPASYQKGDPHASGHVSSVAPPLSPHRSDATEEEVEYVEEDDSVVVPWGEARMSHQSIGPPTGQAEDEGVYSEDEAVAGMYPRR